MGKIIVIIIIFTMLFSGCDGKPGQENAGISTKAGIPASTASTSTTGLPEQNMVRRLVFDVSMKDPQNMQPVFDTGTCTVRAVLSEDSKGNYTGDISISRDKPQTGYRDGHMTLSYSGFLKDTGGNMKPEVKKVLDKMAGEDDKGKSIYGTIPVDTRVTDRRFIEFPDEFLSPMDYVKSYASDEEISFLLSMEGDKAELYLYLHPLAMLKAEGEFKPVPINTAVQPAQLSKPGLYINDRGLSAEVKGVKQMYRLLFLGEKSGDSSFDGTLLYSMTEEKSVAQGVLTAGEKTDMVKEHVKVDFIPFDEKKYRDSGGSKSGSQTTSLSHMAVFKCGGQTILLTAAGNEVFAELPGTSFRGVLSGELTDKTDEIKTTEEESLQFYEAEYLFYSTKNESNGQGKELMDNAMKGMEQAGMKLTEEQLKMMKESIRNMIASPSGQSIWLPEGFIPMTAPMEGDYLEQPPTTVYGGNFQYQEDSLWIEDVLPTYIAKFGKMRDFKEKGGTKTGHRYHEMAFRYGEQLITILMSDNAAGCQVAVIVY